MGDESRIFTYFNFLPYFFSYTILKQLFYFLAAERQNKFQNWPFLTKDFNFKIFTSWPFHANMLAGEISIITFLLLPIPAH